MQGIGIFSRNSLHFSSKRLTFAKNKKSGSLPSKRVWEQRWKYQGKGIPSVEEAMQPFFTTGAEEERSGMGFTIMRSFTDGLEVLSTPGEGTVVRMQKRIGTAAGDVK